MKSTGMSIIPSRACLVFTVLLIESALQLVCAQADTERLKVALVANQAHLDSFPWYKCRYTLTKCEAKSEAAALRGEYKNTRSCEYVLVVDRSKLKFQTVGVLKAPSGKNATRDQTGKLGVSVDFIPNCDLRFNDYSMRYFSWFKNAHVRAYDPPEHDKLAPLSMSYGEHPRHAPANLYLRGEGINPKITGRGEIVMDGKPVVHVHGQAQSFDVEYYFDPSRGSLPLKVVCHNEPPWSAQKFDSVRYLIEAKPCTQGRWFPMRWILLWIYPGRSAVEVQEIRVTELDVDNRPTAKDFAVVIPAGTEIVQELKDAKGAPVAFQLRQEEVVSLEDLPRLAKMLEEKANNPLMDTAIVRPGKFDWVTWMLFAGGAVSLGGAIFIYRKARKNRWWPHAT